MRGASPRHLSLSRRRLDTLAWLERQVTYSCLIYPNQAWNEDRQVPYAEIPMQDVEGRVNFVAACRVSFSSGVSQGLFRESRLLMVIGFRGKGRRVSAYQPPPKFGGLATSLLGSRASILEGLVQRHGLHYIRLGFSDIKAHFPRGTKDYS